MNVLSWQKTTQRLHLGKGILPLQDLFLLDIIQQVSLKIVISVLYLAKCSTKWYNICLWKLGKESRLYSFVVCCLSLQSCLSFAYFAVRITVFWKNLHALLYLELNTLSFYAYSFGWYSTKRTKRICRSMGEWGYHVYHVMFSLSHIICLINFHLYTGLYA
jgi:hypothetical protein